MKGHATGIAMTTMIVTTAASALTGMTAETGTGVTETEAGAMVAATGRAMTMVVAMGAGMAAMMTKLGVNH